jgi:ABC-type branched-subunit amino acid transport system substrate-binding protein
MRCLCLVFLFLAFVQCVRADTQPPKIGFILPLSGDLAFLGNGIRNGALLAKEDIEKQGGSLDLIFEDNRGDLATSARFGSKLVNSDSVTAIVSIISGVGAILKPLAVKAQVLHIGICSDPDVADGRFSFVNYLTAEQGVKRYLQYSYLAMYERA